MNKRFIWFILIAAIAVLFLFFLLMTMNIATLKTKKDVSQGNVAASAANITKKGSKSSKKRYDVFKSPLRKVKAGDESSQPGVDYQSRMKEPLPM
ncbi:MAG: hypothetical protein PHS93_06185 [Candidatus Omnitrophica bacterium]|nr:hypothetical protein [Candidatus Omnitrophota bacterium]MDD5352736.1 hypothetical protein [Candidatus Omnitrophota bacterium]MDD5550335.1 hypothetical protein [Candidatus Omnitrophota bacterium]